MIARLFICSLLLFVLALQPHAAFAASIAQPLGAATAVLTLDPDPPATGTAHVTVALRGASAAALASTSITFGSSMPAMHMSGASGVARSIGAGRYGFDLPLGMAATWNITLHASGGVNGDAVFTIPVGAAAPSAASASSSGMSASAAAGDAGPWRIAAFILLALLVVFIAISRRIRSPWAFAFLGLAAATAISVAAFTAHADAQPSSMNGMDMNAMNDVKGDSAIAVRTVSVSDMGLDARAQSTIYAPGTLAPYLQQDIVARSSGLLTDFSIYAGDRVSAGQLLARLDEPELAARAGASRADASAQSQSANAATLDATSRAPANAAAMQAEAAAATLEAASANADLMAKNQRQRYWRAELAREQTLANEGAVSEQELQDERAQAAAADADAAMASHRVHAAHAQIDGAQAKLAGATASVRIAQFTAAAMQAQAQRAAHAADVDAVLADYTNVVAPMDGVVLKRMIDPGTYVQAGSVIARVAAVDRLRISANVAESRLPDIAIGAPVMATASSGMILRGRVSSIVPVADPATRTSTVEAIVENPGHRAVPGGSVRVMFSAALSLPRGSMRIPSAAIVSGASDSVVWRIAGGAAEDVPVRVLSDDGANAYVRGDLHAGDHVVIDGASDLTRGTRVSEVPR